MNANIDFKASNTIQQHHDITMKLSEDLGRLVSDYELILEDWNLDQLDSIRQIRSKINDTKKEIIINTNKIMRDTFKCVLFGRVSAGKSAFINSLLSRRILPSANGPTTNSFVEIKKSTNGKKFVIFSKNPEEEMHIDSIEQVDGLIHNENTEGSHVDLYYSLEECPLLETIVFVDTPGIDNGKEMDTAVNSECEDADVLILIVNSRDGLGDSEENFILKNQTEFSKFNVSIVFNQWDVIEPKRRTMLKQKYTDRARDYLCRLLHVSPTDADQRIYFISATERLNIKNTETPNSVTEGWEDRNNTFNLLWQYLETSMGASSIVRKELLVQHDYDVIQTMLGNMESNIISLRTQLMKKMKNELNSLIKFNDTINTEITLTFKENYQPLLMICCNISVIETSDRDKEDQLRLLLTQTVIETVKTLKENIIGHVPDTTERKIFIKILEERYFPGYLSTDPQMNKISMKDLRGAILKIVRVKKLGTGLIVVGTAALAAGIIASGGVLAGVLIPIPTMIAAPILGITGGLLGGGAGGGISGYVCRLKLKAFRPFYKCHERILKEWWRAIILSNIDSYEIFENGLINDIDKIIEPLKKRLTDLKKEMESMNDELKKIQT